MSQSRMKRFRVTYRVISHELADAIEADDEEQAKQIVERRVFSRLADEDGVFEVEIDRVLEL